jgi:hypothetical protein
MTTGDAVSSTIPSPVIRKDPIFLEMKCGQIDELTRMHSFHALLYTKNIKYHCRQTDT